MLEITSKFFMQKIRVFEAFAGIGAQSKSIKLVNEQNNKVNFEVVGISEWDAFCNISYAAIHKNLNELKIKEILENNGFITLNDKMKYWKNNVFSFNSKYPARYIRDVKALDAIIASSLINNNFSDITRINVLDIEQLNIDLLTYSFPCQGLSAASMGRSKGINNAESTSHLVWEIDRILSNLNKKPNYLLLENVTTLVKKYKHEYDMWIQRLDEHGYKTFTTILNSYDHGSLQIRKRVFAISVKKELKTPFNNDEEYSKFFEKIRNKNSKHIEKQYTKIFDINNNRWPREALDSIMNNTPSRIKMLKDNWNIGDLITAQKNDFKIKTLTTKQDRNPNIGFLELKNSIANKLNYRFITPREAYKIMGFTDEDYDRLNYFIEANILKREHLYRQAGNSIDIHALKDVFKVIAKIHELNFKGNTKDEK